MLPGELLVRVATAALGDTAPRPEQHREIVGHVAEGHDGRKWDAHRAAEMCERSSLVDAHDPASFYEAFPPAEAHRLARKLEIPYMP